MKKRGGGPLALSDFLPAPITPPTPQDDEALLKAAFKALAARNPAP